METVKMDKKLTLSLNARVIENAKVYAKENSISLSRLIEKYLQAVSRQSTKTEEDADFSPTVKKLLGLVELPNNYDYRKDYGNHLIEKYK